jgi:hypothetical protein
MPDACPNWVIARLQIRIRCHDSVDRVTRGRITAAQVQWLIRPIAEAGHHGEDLGPVGTFSARERSLVEVAIRSECQIPAVLDRQSVGFGGGSFARRASQQEETSQVGSHATSVLKCAA